MAGPAHKNDDDAVLRRLYDEPDADDAGGAVEREVESLRRVRGAIADYARATDVEPPSRGLDELMAAARARVSHAAPAVAPVATPGFWARARAWFAPIVRHPALASGAAVVLIGGLAGVLYLNGVTGAERDAPAVAADEESVGARGIAPSEPAPTSPAAAQTGSAQGMFATLDDVRTASPSVETSGDVPPDPDPKPERPAPRPPTDKKNADVAKSGEREKGAGGGGGAKADLEGLAGRGTVYRNEPAANGVADTQQKPTLEIAAPDPVPGKKQAPKARAPTPTKDPAPAPGPAPAPPSAGTDDAPGAGGDEDRDAAEDVDTTTTKGESSRPADAPTRPRGPSVEQLTRQARTAARSGDCGVVKTIGRRVRSAAPDYYKRSFATDADIKKCL